MNKYSAMTTVCAVLLLLTISCRKGIDEQSINNLAQNSQKEQVTEEPATPLDKPIPLPSGGKQVAVSSIQGAGTAAAPVILVHGLGGFGPGEMAGFNYWGGFDNIPLYLTNSGYPAYATSVGAFSSNWDRAVDLYYYIKGGYVDYGKLHSGKFGHNQKKSRYYPGVYPQWDANHPVHLLGHSMGGITVRKLLTLLEKGDAGEQADPAHADLFSGGKIGWVKSITTISTPHNGATLAYKLLPDYSSFVRDLVTAVAALAGTDLNTEGIYDFGLEQWGLERQPGESFASYSGRVVNSKIWTTDDYSGHDVTPEAALEENQIDLDSKNVYYFSVTTLDTDKGLLTGWAYPRLNMFPLLTAIAYPLPVITGLGNYTQKAPGKVVIDAKWWPNDGAANTYGMSGPATSMIETYNPAVPLAKGVWNHLGVYNGYDHFAIIGMGLIPNNVRPFYRNIASLLGSIE